MIPIGSTACAGRRLTTSDAIQIPNSWWPDGRYLAFDSRRDISIFHRADRRVTPWLVTRYSEGGAAFSPNNSR